LGDHEAIVAQASRQMRLSGDWLVPHFLETPFIRKAPLPFWLVAACSYLFDNDSVTGLPVTAAAARLPSALCAFGAVVLLWQLASSMFDRRTGLVAALVAGSSVTFLLYAPNATAEMPLTFCCVWAYYHFWFAATAKSGLRRFCHSMTFYLALGFAMLAKGPVPVALVGFPLAVWWYVHRPLRVVARRGFRGLLPSIVLFRRSLGPRTLAVFARLWFVPGILLFALVFIPWMMAVAKRYPFAWDLWNWQFLQRAKGDYPDTRHRSIAFYIPIVGGLLLPWTFLVIEAAAAPWMRRYARWHRPLLFAGLWGLLGVLSMSLMEFKKPYYVLPATPGLILLVAVVAQHFFLSDRRSVRGRQTNWPIRIGLAISAAAAPAAFWMWISREEWRAPHSKAIVAIVGIIGSILLAAAFQAYRRGRGSHALILTAAVSALAFHAIWYGAAKEIDNLDKVAKLASMLDENHVPRSSRVFWADARPDARLSFYYNRASEHMIDAAEIVSQGIFNRRSQKLALEKMALQRGLEIVRSTQPVYLILRRENYEHAVETLALRTTVIGVVQGSKDSNKQDWFVVTNAPDTHDLP